MDGEEALMNQASNKFAMNNRSNKKKNRRLNIVEKDDSRLFVNITFVESQKEYNSEPADRHHK